MTPGMKVKTRTLLNSARERKAASNALGTQSQRRSDIIFSLGGLSSVLI